MHDALDIDYLPGYKLTTSEIFLFIAFIWINRFAGVRFLFVSLFSLLQVYKVI